MLKLLMILTMFAVSAVLAAPAAAEDSPPAVTTGDAGKDLPAREKLYRELGEARDVSAVAVLSRAALSDPEPGARVDAVLALRKIGGPAALKALLEALAAEKHKGVRIQAINSLGFFSAPEALARLRDIAVNDPDKDLRVAAVLALSRLGDAQTLTAGFDSEKDPAVKLAIVDAVGRTEDGEKELGKIRAKNKDPKVTKRLNLYAPARKVVKKAAQKAPTGKKTIR
jgi:HEAT repeat protein